MNWSVDNSHTVLSAAIVDPMDRTALHARLAVNDGALTMLDLRQLGLDDVAIRLLVRSGVLRRVRPGCFVDAARHSAATRTEQHLLEARATLLPSAALFADQPTGCLVGSHHTALALWGCPVLEEDLGPIEVCRAGGVWQRRSRPPVLIHGGVAPEQVRHTRGVLVVPADLAIAQVARTTGARSALVAADGARRRELVTMAQLRDRTQSHPSPALTTILPLVDGRSESPGESWAKLVFAGMGLHPEVQVPITDRSGTVIARVDFLFRSSRIIVEFDGAVKYAGADGRDALVREKRREDALRALGYRVVRLTWADLADPHRVLALFAAALAS